METFLKWFTGADAKAAAIRSITTVLTTAVSVFLFLKWDPTLLQVLLPQVPVFVSAIFALVALGVETYRVLYKTNSNRAQEVAVAVDKGIAAGIITKETPLEVKTPAGVKDLPVEPHK